LELEISGAMAAAAAGQTEPRVNCSARRKHTGKFMPLSEDVSDNAMSENAETYTRGILTNQSARGLFSTRELPLFRLPASWSRAAFSRNAETRGTASQDALASLAAFLCEPRIAA